MTFDNSPKLSDYKKGLPTRRPDLDLRRKRIWLLIAGLTIMVFALATINILQDPSARGFLAGEGEITGVVLDNQNMPVSNAQILIIGADVLAFSDSSGKFMISHVPSGSQSLVVAKNGVGMEYPVHVVAGEIVTVGDVRFQTTAIPDL